MKSNSNLFPKSSSARQMEALKKKIREAKAEEKKKKKKNSLVHVRDEKVSL